MNNYRIALSGLLAGAIFVAACQPLSTPAPTQDLPTAQPPTAVPPTPRPSPEPVSARDAEQAAAEALAEALNVPIETVRIVSTEAVTWSDSCLGFFYIQALCAQAETPGFRILLEADAVQYQVHTNHDGSAHAPDQALRTSVDAEQAALKAYLAASGLLPDQVRVVRSAPTLWPTGCLTYPQPESCDAAPVNGWQVTLEADGREVLYATNADLSEVVPNSLALEFERMGGIAGLNDRLWVFASGEVIVSRGFGADPLRSTLTAAELASLSTWLNDYQQVQVMSTPEPGTADGLSITFLLYGQGTATANEPAAYGLLDWAQTVLTRVETESAS
jgi:hypothetical protein